MALCLCVALCAFGCNGGGGGGDDGDVTVINIPYSTGGLGKDWITGPGARFEELVGDKSYAEGKHGVKINAVESDVRVDTITSTSFPIVGLDRSSDPKTLGAQGTAYDLTDLVTNRVIDTRNGVEMTIEDKLDPAFANYFKSFDRTKYYAVPTMEYYGGLTYDPVTFTNKGLYISACNVTGANDAAFEEEKFGEVFGDKDSGYENSLGIVKFESEKFGVDLYLAFDADMYYDGVEELYCVGPNGQAGDYDDGLPSSVYELLTLCDYMHSKSLATPFALSGKHPNYSNMFGDGLFHSLAGNYDGYSIMSLDTQGREVDVVVGWSQEKLFPGVKELEHLYKPITKKVKITEATGYYTTWMLARYWAAVTQDIIYSLDWFVPGFKSTSVDHIATQKNFIFGNYSPNPSMPATAFLMEGSYWNNESRIRGNFTELYGEFYPMNSRDVRWCPLPVTIDVPVTGEIVYTNEEKGYYDAEAYAQGLAGHEPTLIVVTRAYMIINNKYKDDDEIINASLDFLAFLMTEDELSYYALEAGVFKPMIYDINEDIVEGKPAWNSYMQSLWNVRSKAKVVHYDGNNETFYKYGTLFERGFSSGAMSTHEPSHYLSFINRRETTKNFHTFWENTIKTKDGWKSFYAGDPDDVILYTGTDNVAVDYTPYKNTHTIDWDKVQN